MTTDTKTINFTCGTGGLVKDNLTVRQYYAAAIMSGMQNTGLTDSIVNYLKRADPSPRAEKNGRRAAQIMARIALSQANAMIQMEIDMTQQDGEQYDADL